MAFPAISTGVYGYPVELAAPIALGVARDHLLEVTPVERITFVLFSRDALDVFVRALQDMDRD